MFHFKKFSIDDSKAAMKIGTDSVLLGAWTPCENETHILDIGAGSGILAMMMAQRNDKIEVDAVELEYEAALQARQNIQFSPWPEQIKVFNTSIQEFSNYTPRKYSLVISNPPFFSDSLKAPDKARSMARHNNTLPVTDLLKNTSKVLTQNGKAAFIITAGSFEYWKSEAAKYSLFPIHITYVKSSPIHKPHRVLVMFSQAKKTVFTEDEVVIYISGSVYSKEYQELTKDFYLKF